MTTSLLAAVAIALLASRAEACAFPKGGCKENVCNGLDVTIYDDLLNAEDSPLGPGNSFNMKDNSKKGDWSKFPKLGYFYNMYNPTLPKLDEQKDATSSKAPVLNYLRFRNTLGDKISDEPLTLAECCNLCRTTPDCQYYLFNPQVTSLYNKTYVPIPGSKKTKLVLVYVGQDFSSGLGDCYNVAEGTQDNKKLVTSCSSSTKDVDLFNNKTKPVFFGGVCNTKIEDDPHFIGARGTRYDFNGQLDRSFCLIADERLQVNTLLRGYEDTMGGETAMRSWMKELGFAWVSASGERHTLQLVARGGKDQKRGDGFLSQVVFDGAPLNVPSAAGESLASADFELSYVGMRALGPYEVDDFTLRIGDLLELGIAMRVAHPKLQTPDDAEVHFNMDVRSLKVSDNVHGVLGQTYRRTQSQQLKAIKYSILSRILGAPVQADGQTGKGFLEGEVSDYITSSVVATDCKFSALA